MEQGSRGTMNGRLEDDSSGLSTLQQPGQGGIRHSSETLWNASTSMAYPENAVDTFPLDKDNDLTNHAFPLPLPWLHQSPLPNPKLNQGNETRPLRPKCASRLSFLSGLLLSPISLIILLSCLFLNMYLLWNETGYKE